MKYTAKDVCTIYNLNRETLRYYEKFGLIHPEISEINRYRYYDDWDIFLIGECKRYRSLGYSLKEIEEILHQDGLVEFTQKVEAKQADYQRLIQYYTNLANKNNEFLKALHTIPDYLNVCEIRSFEGTYFFPGTTDNFNQRNFELLFQKEAEGINSDLMSNYAFIDAAFLISIDDYQNHIGHYSWGSSIKKKWADYLNLSTDKLHYLPPHQALYTIIDAGNRGDFKFKNFNHINEYLMDKNLELDGPVIGTILTRLYESTEYHRYIEVWLPYRLKSE